MLSRRDLMLLVGMMAVVSRAPGGKTATIPTPEADSTAEVNLNDTTAANSFGNESLQNSKGLDSIQKVINVAFSLPPWIVNASSPPPVTNVMTVSDEPTQPDGAVTPSAATKPVHVSQARPAGAVTQDTPRSTTPRPMTTRKGSKAASGPSEPPDQRQRFEYDYKTLRVQGLIIAFILFVMGIMVLLLDRCRAPRCSGCRRRSKSGKYTIATNT